MCYKSLVMLENIKKTLKSNKYLIYTNLKLCIMSFIRYITLLLIKIEHIPTTVFILVLKFVFLTVVGILNIKTLLPHTLRPTLCALHFAPRYFSPHTLCLNSATQGTVCSSLGKPANNVTSVATFQPDMSRLGVSSVTEHRTAVSTRNTPD